MFVAVRFRWQDNPTGTPIEARRLWVRSDKGDEWLLAFMAIDQLVGEAERKRLVKVAIKNGSGLWHGADGSWHERAGYGFPKRLEMFKRKRPRAREYRPKL